MRWHILQRKKKCHFQYSGMSHECLTKNVVTLEGIHNMETEYYPLYFIVRNVPTYFPVVLSAKNIDCWKPANDDKIQCLLPIVNNDIAFMKRCNSSVGLCSCCQGTIHPCLLWCVPNDSAADQSGAEVVQAHVNVMKQLSKHTLKHEQFTIWRRNGCRSWDQIPQLPLVFWKCYTVKMLRVGDPLQIKKETKRLMHYAFSHGGPSMYADLCAAKNHGKKPSMTFLKLLVVWLKMGVEQHHTIMGKAYLTSISALYDGIWWDLLVSWCKQWYFSEKCTTSILAIATTVCCPQYPSQSILNSISHVACQ